MSQSPALTSSSNKTATFVVLIVFLQLLVIAVLGLGAISRDRREGVREAQERADADAVVVAEGSLGRLDRDLVEVFTEAASVLRPERLRELTDRPRGRVVDAVYQVDERGVIYWFTGTERLWLPDAVCEELETWSSQQEPAIAARLAELRAANVAGAFKRAVDVLQPLLHEHPLLVQPGEGGLPVGTGVDWARALVDFAVAARGGQEDETPPAPASSPAGPVSASLSDDELRSVLLRALEVDAINRGRSQYAAPTMRHYLDALARTIDASILCEPEAEPLGHLIATFRRARSLLDTLRPALTTAVARFREAGLSESAPPRLLDVAGDLLVLSASRSFPRRVSVIRLDPEALLQVAAGSVDHEGLARQGLRLALARREDAVPGRPLMTRDLARPGAFELPFRALLYRERPVALPSGGPTEGFYLGIIGLAALGLVVGSIVLLRIWRREVRLARLKADFVSNLSHELKTPLTSISLFTEMLQEGKLATEEERAEGLSILAQESQRLQRIVARMIDVARREARGTPYDLAPGDLNVPIREAAQRFRRIVTEPGLDLVVDLGPEPLPVLLDAAAVDDAVTNLLSNAWKYKRGDRARIEVRSRRRGRKAEIVVNDDGIGIPRHERKRVFAMFYRAENYLTREVAGTGLGLALVRTIVRAHRGRVRVETGPSGVGTTFRMRFPIARRALLGRPAPPLAASPPTPSKAASTP